VLFLTRFSGCLAYLDEGFIIDDTAYTVDFYNGQIGKYHQNDLALSILQDMFESLRTYHIPAEVALGSINEDSTDHIEACYTGVIDRITTWRREIPPPATIDRVAVKQLLDAIITWTETYIQIAKREPLVQEYIYQKIFVLEIQVLAMLSPSANRSRLIQLAAMSIATFDKGRVCVCEAIMLSVFLKIPYKDEKNKWKPQAIRRYLGIETLWDCLEGEPKQDEIRTYILNAFVLEKKSTETTPVSIRPLVHVHDKLISPLMELARAAFLHDMNPIMCKQLLAWAKSVWGRLRRIGKKFEQNHLEKEFMRNIVELTTLSSDKMQALHFQGYGSNGRNGVAG
jgi:hypothetical protein